MTVYYVDDGGSATAPYDTYAKAHTTLAALIAAVTLNAGDEIHMGHDHAESTASNISLAFANGTEEQPIRIISTNTSTDAYQAGASITASSASDITIASGCSVWYGVTFVPTDDFIIGSGVGMVVRFYGCTITATDRPCSVNGLYANILLQDCTVTTADASLSFVRFGNSGITLVARGGTWTAASAGSGQAMTNFAASEHMNKCVFENVDFSGSTADMNLGSFNTVSRACELIYRRCKLPSSYALPTITSNEQIKLRVESCSGGTSTDPFIGINRWEDDIGVIVSDTANYRNGGASDGYNNYSWKMTPGANCSYFSPLESPPIIYWAEPTAQTVTIFIASDATLQDDEVWMEIEHPDTAGTANPDHLLIDTKIDPLATPSNLTWDIDTSWTDSGTNVTTKQKLVSSSFTPTEAGPVIIRVFATNPSDNVYIDPRPVIT